MNRIAVHSYNYKSDMLYTINKNLQVIQKREYIIDAKIVLFIELSTNRIKLVSNRKTMHNYIMAK